MYVLTGKKKVRKKLIRLMFILNFLFIFWPSFYFVGFLIFY